MGKIRPEVIGRVLVLPHRSELVDTNKTLVALYHAVQFGESIEKTAALAVRKLPLVLANAHHDRMFVEYGAVRRILMHLDDRILVLGTGAGETSRNNELNPGPICGER